MRLTKKSTKTRLTKIFPQNETHKNMIQKHDPQKCFTKMSFDSFRQFQLYFAKWDIGHETEDILWNHAMRHMTQRKCNSQRSIVQNKTWDMIHFVKLLHKTWDSKKFISQNKVLAMRHETETWEVRHFVNLLHETWDIYFKTWWNH